MTKVSASVTNGGTMNDAVTTAKVELGSPAWLALAGGWLTEHIPALGDVLTGVSFSMCECFTSAPAHLADEDGRAAWWFAINGPTVSFGAGARADVDVRVDVDYDEVLPNAREVTDLDDPETLAR